MFKGCSTPWRGGKAIVASASSINIWWGLSQHISSAHSINTSLLCYTMPISSSLRSTWHQRFIKDWVDQFQYQLKWLLSLLWSWPAATFPCTYMTTKLLIYTHRARHACQIQGSRVIQVRHIMQKLSKSTGVHHRTLALKPRYQLSVHHTQLATRKLSRTCNEGWIRHALCENTFYIPFTMKNGPDMLICHCYATYKLKHNALPSVHNSHPPKSWGESSEDPNEQKSVKHSMVTTISIA